MLDILPKAIYIEVNFVTASQFQALLSTSYVKIPIDATERLMNFDFELQRQPKQR